LDEACYQFSITLQYKSAVAHGTDDLGRWDRRNMRDLQSIFEEINSASCSHDMSQFQAIRRHIHGKTGTMDKIFTSQTMDKKKKKWAFNWGGRTEL
jgi:hypothetical protein